MGLLSDIFGFLEDLANGSPYNRLINNSRGCFFLWYIIFHPVFLLSLMDSVIPTCLLLALFCLLLKRK